MEEAVYSDFFRMEEANWWFAGTRAIQMDFLEQAGVLGQSVEALDIGCGTGLWMTELGRKARVTGLDNSPSAIAFCKERGLKHLVVGSAAALPFKDASFDLVTANGVIEHLEDDVQMVRECMRVLKPGGHALFLTSAFGFLWSAHDDLVHHKRRYSRRGFRDVLKAGGLTPVRVEYVTSAVFPAVAVVRLAQRAMGWSPKPEEVLGVIEVPSPINGLLRGILTLEKIWLRYLPLPFGVNLVSLAKKAA